MKTACFIPIKAHSERVPGKNFRLLCGKPLYQHVIENCIKAACFDDIYVDTNSAEVATFCKSNGVKIIERKEELARNTANGNDLLNYHYDLFPNYDYYFQLFATAPFLQPKSIAAAVNTLVCSGVYDSTFTVLKEHSFFWYCNSPVNYRPCILPRSQDMEPVYEETTGLYGMTNAALKKYRCRIGANPFMLTVGKFEAVDINTEEDLLLAEYIGKTHWKL
ncbi:MAG: acylneuraminate cytidylyltransferase family protein [Clostridia bacterium]|nr:acylneuraminate cytidylyltransferase family protein [Clostridia bacterium]